MAKRKKVVKLPKRIAGVKIPKAARKGPVADFLNSSGGQVLVAEALVLLAGAYGHRRMRRNGRIGSEEGIAEAISDASARLSHAFGEGVRAFRAALAESPAAVLEEPSQAETSSDDLAGFDDMADIVGAKKKRRGRSMEDVNEPTGITP